MSKVAFTNTPLKGECIITLDSVKYQLKFSANTMRVLCENEGIAFTELSAFFKRNPIKAMGSLVRAAIQDSVIRYGFDGEVPSLDEVCVHLDELSSEEREALNTAWSNAQFMGNAVTPKVVDQE